MSITANDRTRTLAFADAPRWLLAHVACRGVHRKAMPTLTGTAPTETAGTCDARFSAVREAFRENLAHRGEIGAAVVVIVGGRQVVELWGGWADAKRSRAWQQDTLVNVFSVGKALTGLCALMLISRGLLDLDEPISARWPQFAAADKEHVTVRQLLSHQAGLAAIERQLAERSLYDWGLVTAALAEQRPWWTPGEGHGYHVHTFGFLVGELVRRVTDQPIGLFLRREIAEALDAQVSFGCVARERQRCAEYVFNPERVGSLERIGSLQRITHSERRQRAAVDPHLRERAYLNPPGATGIGTVNTPAWQDAELPSANLHASALGIARVYDALISRVPSLIDSQLLAEATKEAASGADLVLGRPSRFGLGFQLTQPERPLGPNAHSFGHFGTGGALGFADPDAHVAFAYVMNHGGPQWQDPRNRVLIDAVYQSLEQR